MISTVEQEKKSINSLIAEAAGEAERPFLVIRPTRGFAAINLQELWQYRDLLLTLAIRDVKVRYKQTALGVIWVI